MKILHDHAGDPVVRLLLTREKRSLRCTTTRVRDAPQTHIDLEPSPVGRNPTILLKITNPARPEWFMLLLLLVWSQ
jgi:hypothetical protein